MLCQQCHYSCATCDTSATDCLTCSNVTGRVHYLLGTECLEKCPATYYGIDADNECAACHLSCQTCFGPNVDECYSCRQNSDDGKDYFLQYGTTTCVETCPDGQYPNATSLKCLICDSNCDTCSSDSVTCDTCYMDGGAHVFLEGTVCVEKCKDGFYGENSTYTCDACADGCATCFGPDLTDCFTCRLADDGTTNFYKLADKTECMDSACPNGQFISSRYSFRCELCATQCKTCEGEADNCTTTEGCADNYFYYNTTNDCLANCPKGLYNGAIYCENCEPGCA